MYPGPERRKNIPLLLQRYERLLEITRTLSSTLDLPFLLRNIIQAAVELTDTEAASIMLFDSLSGQLRFEATTNEEPSKMEKITVPLEGSIAGTIFTSGQPLIIADAMSDPRHFRKVDDQITFVTRSILGVPLVSKQKSIGVLQALNKKGDGQFTHDDVETMEALAAQAAITIVNARLFQQSDTIAELVHELRQPLNALNAAAGILMRPSLPPEKRTEFVQTIQNETGRLSTMTTEFLDLAKLESGRMRFVYEPFNLVELANECIKVVASQANNRQVQLYVALPNDFPSVNGDRGKIKQVLINLLTNAIKYNREGGDVYITGNAQGRGAKVGVTDTGRGIPPDSLPRMFEKFYRVPDAEGMTQGTGLGLAITKRIVEAHGGEMAVESTVNVGTTFSFTLSLA
jgi:signal transduction histidine kinase